MRSIKNTSIEFGLLNIPVKIQVARRDSYPRFKQFCPEGHKVHYKKYCEECNKEISWEEIKKGYEIGGEVVKFDKEETKSDLENIEIEGFTENLNPLHFKDFYYLSPNKSDKQYTLFREFLKKNSVLPIGRVAIRSREELVSIIPYKKTLLLVKIYQKSEIREEPEPEDVEIDESQLKQLEGLIQKVDIKEVKNTKQEEIEEKIEKRISEDKKTSDKKEEKVVA